MAWALAGNSGTNPGVKFKAVLAEKSIRWGARRPSTATQCGLDREEGGVMDRERARMDFSASTRPPWPPHCHCPSSQYSRRAVH